MKQCGLILVGLLVLGPSAASAQGGGSKRSFAEQRAAVKELAAQIDKLIAAPWAKAGIKPAPLASDGEFYRRLNLDLVGKIPSPTDSRDYIDHMNQFEWGWLYDDRFEKRYDWVEKLLEWTEDNSNPKFNYFSRHWAALFRAHMIQSFGNEFQVQFALPSFEAFLRQKLEANTGYDKIVYEIMTGSPFDQRMYNPGSGIGASTAAFYLAAENKAENLAGAASRVFLGVKIECAQCHPHPFAKWTKNQFWEFAAFFNGIQPVNRRGEGLQPAVLRGREIQVPGGKMVKAKFLDGTEPKWKDGVDSRATLADWIIARNNPFFAKAAADTVWTYFFGYSLVEPIIEPSDDYPVTYPELLELLAREFTASGYDLRFLVRAIVHTEAYQRSTQGHADANKLDYFFYARMPVRAMTPEQLYDSFMVATDLDRTQGMQFTTPQQFNGQMSPRAEFITKFTSIEKRTENSTSILQALFLMNGKFLNDHSRPETNKSLDTLARQETSTAQKIETMYLIVLSRLPRAEESERLVRYVESGGPSRDRRRALADVYWALLNSGEFMLNH